MCGDAKGKGRKGKKNTRRAKYIFLKENREQASASTPVPILGKGSSIWQILEGSSRSCHWVGDAWEERGMGTPAYTCLYPNMQAATSSRVLGLQQGDATSQGTQKWLEKPNKHVGFDKPSGRAKAQPRPWAVSLPGSPRHPRDLTGTAPGRVSAASGAQLCLRGAVV